MLTKPKRVQGVENVRTHALADLRRRARQTVRNGAAADRDEKTRPGVNIAHTIPAAKTCRPALGCKRGVSGIPEEDVGYVPPACAFDPMCARGSHCALLGIGTLPKHALKAVHPHARDSGVPLPVAGDALSSRVCHGRTYASCRKR